jgi:RNA polymerase sigma-70 factor (ECF subfamily)
MVVRGVRTPADTYGVAVAAEPGGSQERMAAGRSAPAAVDDESREWLVRLSGEGSHRDEAIRALHALLVKAARFAVARRRALIPYALQDQLDDLAIEAADDALVEILARLNDYRGESRFTTWAWKFAIFEASEAIRRRSWMGREIPVEDAGWTALSRELSPERSLEQRELLAALKSGIESELTPRQRIVFVALALNRVPVDVLADRMGSTRGALYKTLHDARQRLRAHLEE